MSLPELCLKRPVATATCVLAALVLGAVSLARLPVEYLPEIQGRSRAAVQKAFSRAWQNLCDLADRSTD